MVDPGDYSSLAAAYVHRPGYSRLVLKILTAYVSQHVNSPRVVDVGAGTGKLSRDLAALGHDAIRAVEPNDEMRRVGQQETKDLNIRWSAGSAETTGLGDSSADWLLMASSFHWTDAKRSLSEFRRVLGPGGYFTALWNPRDLESSPLQMEIETQIRKIVPALTRKSSGSAEFTQTLHKTLVSTGDFTDVVFVEAAHEVTMTRERYLAVWRSVNDLQAQAGPERFEQIMTMIEGVTAGHESLCVPYKTRSWTAQAV